METDGKGLAERRDKEHKFAEVDRDFQTVICSRIKYLEGVAAHPQAQGEPDFILSWEEMIPGSREKQGEGKYCM